MSGIADGHGDILALAQLGCVEVACTKEDGKHIVDIIRGMEVNRALGTLHFSKKAASEKVEKLLRSAIANWEQKNERKAEDGELYVTVAYVDEGVTLKRMRPAPQGRGYRIRKRSNHVTLFVGTKTND